MNPKLEKLIAEKERNEKEVEVLQHRQQRLENRLNICDNSCYENSVILT